MINKPKIEMVKISDLIECPQNPRQNEDNVQAVVKSIEAFGYTNPVLVRKSNKMIIAGHTRVKALQELGEKTVPVIYLDMSDIDSKAYMIADNKLTENVMWDYPKLTDLFLELDEANVNMDLTGFDEGEIQQLLTPDEVEESEPGELGGGDGCTQCPKCGHRFEK